ncbi:atp4 subunit B of the stator stalk of mitochondrial F1F0 ATP synthase [Entomophthora muscae]|uniref:Atp4 subunit B of the stator stalk of mitochondrial F1F0 ATP synthase n=1 Tax=Entomophthora muscae TaxID=34485 RepID=A0ACC2UA50_9FUNG|nr:atp4 subunit B of the stator stalk of mitochondrial F1F0 ATP synthase [Entomophthora muscae]
MSKEMAEMQSKIFTLKQQVSVASEIKATLDSWVRHENALREREQKLIASQVLSNIEKALKDPKMQTSLLKEAIAEVQKLTAKK